MAGSRASRMGRAGYIIGLPVIFLALGATIRAQVPGPTSPAPPGDVLARNPSSSPPAGKPAASFADIADYADTSRSMPWKTPPGGGDRIESPSSPDPLRRGRARPVVAEPWVGSAAS